MKRGKTIKIGIVLLAISAASLLCARTALAQTQEQTNQEECVNTLRSVRHSAQKVLNQTSSEYDSIFDAATLENYMDHPEKYPQAFLLRRQIAAFIVYEKLNSDDSPRRLCANPGDRSAIMKTFETMLEACTY
jgi:hypothetical protein